MKTIRDLSILLALAALPVLLCMAAPTRGKTIPSRSAKWSEVRVPDAAHWPASLKSAQPDTVLLLSGGDSYASVLKVGRKFKPGHPLVIDGMGTAILRGGLNLQSAEWVTVRNLRIVGAPADGVRTGTCKGLVFENVTVDRSAANGFLIGSSAGVSINKCAGTNCGRGAGFHGLYVANGSSDVSVTHCTFSGNAVAGIQCNGPSGTKNVTIDDCTLSCNGWTGKGAALNILETTNVTVANTRVEGNLFQGVSCTAGSTVTFSGGTILFRAGEGQKCANVSNGATLTLSGVTVQMGVVKTGWKPPSGPWWDVHNGTATGQETCKNPDGTPAAGASK